MDGRTSKKLEKVVYPPDANSPLTTLRRHLLFSIIMGDHKTSMNKLNLKKVFSIIALIFVSPSTYAENNVFDLTEPLTLLAACTVENDGYIGFDLAKTNVEKVFAEGRYERTLMSCYSFIKGVSATVSYEGKASFCLPSVSLEDMKAAVVITLKQKYKSVDNSVPIIIEALTKNWPCKS